MSYGNIKDFKKGQEVIIYCPSTKETQKGIVEKVGKKYVHVKNTSAPYINSDKYFQNYSEPFHMQTWECDYLLFLSEESLKSYSDFCKQCEEIDDFFRLKNKRDLERCLSLEQAESIYKILFAKSALMNE